MEKITDIDKFLSINQKLLLEVKLGGENAGGVYDSRVEDIEGGISSIYLCLQRKGEPYPPLSRKQDSTSLM